MFFNLERAVAEGWVSYRKWGDTGVWEVRTEGWNRFGFWFCFKMKISC